MRPLSDFFQGPAGGVGCALVASVAFAVMGFVVHLMPPGIASSQLIFVRAVLGLGLLGLVLKARVSHLFRRDSLIVWLRSAFGTCSVIAYYWTLRRAAIADAQVLSDLAPVFVMIFALMFWRRRPGRAESIALTLVVAGALLLDFGEGSLRIPPLVMSVGLLSALFAAFAFMALRRATRNFSREEIVWCFSLVLAVSAPLIPDGPWIAQPPLPVIVLMIAAGLIGIFGQLLLTASFKELNANVASALGLTATLFGSLFDAIATRRLPSPSVMMAYGLMLAGIWAARRASRMPQND